MSAAVRRWSARLLGRRPLAGGAVEVWLDAPQRPEPGQFLLLDLGGSLPRPFSPFRVAEGEGRISLLLRPGRAARQLTGPGAPQRVWAMGFLGRGFPLPFPGEGTVHLVAEAGRLAPFWGLAQRLRHDGRPARLWVAGEGAAVAGSREVSRLVEGAHRYARPGEAWAAALAAAREGDILAVGGPEDLLVQARAEALARGLTAYLALERVMGCGVGACLGCPVRAARPGHSPYLRVCADGPVFAAGDVIL